MGSRGGVVGAFRRGTAPAMGSQRGFTMLETMAALGIVALLLFAGLRMATLARAPGATAEAAAQLDAALALARSLARASGNGATLLALPRNDPRGNALPGFRLVLYRGRPNAPGAASLTRELPLVADASLREASVGAPPFALFFRRDGSAVALARPTLSGSAAQPRFAIIAAEPPCPSATGLLLSVMRNGATVTRSIPCPVTDGGGLAAPQASMTPNPPALAPPALSFAWPSAPVQWFAIAEFGYRGWFAASGGAMESFTCRANGAAIVAFPNSPPYSGPQSLADARSVPSSPNGVPYAYAASASTAAGAMDDAPAHFPVHPIGAGLCIVPLADAFAQRKDTWGNPLDVAMRVMGWLRLAANGGTATSQSAPLSIASAPLTSGQSVTVNASKRFDNDPGGIAFEGLAWNPASCGSALTFTASGNNTAGSGATGTATHSFLITDSTPPASALTCTGTITDQYNEPPVAFTVNVAAAAVAMKTWPAYLEVGANGSSLGQSSSSIIAMAHVQNQGLLASLTARMGPWINTALGGGIADAFYCPSPAPGQPNSGGANGCSAYCPPGTVYHGSGCSAPGGTPIPSPPPPSITPGPCYAEALTGPGGGPDTTIASAPIAVQNALDNALAGLYGSGVTVADIGVDSSGCIDYLNASANAWEPVPKFGGLAYEPSDTAKSYNIGNLSCSSTYVTSGPWQPASQTGVAALLDVVGGSTAGSCTIDLTDGNNSNPQPDAGKVNVGVIGPCPAGTSVLPIGLGCFAPPPLSIGSWNCSLNGTNASGTSTTTYGFTIGPLPIVAKTAPPPVPSSVGIVSGVGSTYSGPIFTRTGPGTVYVFALTESKSPGQYCKPIISFQYSYDGITLN